MPTALQTPLREGQAEKVGPKRYRKQVLPVGHVEHDGKKLEFTKPYLEKLAASFNDGKMDQTPFILVEPDNKHSQDPEKVRGDVEAMEVSDDGLYAVVSLSDRGVELIKDNPKLGVSARINQDEMVIEHVAGTVNPVVKGMKPWEALDLSKPADDVEFFDLSDGEFKVPSSSTLTTDFVSTDALSAEETKSLKALAARLGGKDASDSETLTDEDIAKLLSADAKDSEEEPEPVALSKEAQDKIDLAQKDARDAKAAADSAADKLAEAEWRNTEREFLEKGVPPSLLKLAKPHLSTASSTIELSKSDSQASAMLKMLHEAEGTIELAERGRSAAEDDDEAAQAKEIAKSDAWGKV